jgi:hypothetical protein
LPLSPRSLFAIFVLTSACSLRTLAISRSTLPCSLRSLTSSAFVDRIDDAAESIPAWMWNSFQRTCCRTISSCVPARRRAYKGSVREAGRPVRQTDAAAKRTFSCRSLVSRFDSLWCSLNALNSFATSRFEWNDSVESVVALSSTAFVVSYSFASSSELAGVRTCSAWARIAAKSCVQATHPEICSMSRQRSFGDCRATASTSPCGRGGGSLRKRQMVVTTDSARIASSLACAPGRRESSWP